MDVWCNNSTGNLIHFGSELGCTTWNEFPRRDSEMSFIRKIYNREKSIEMMVKRDGFSKQEKKEKELTDCPFDRNPLSRYG